MLVVWRVLWWQCGGYNDGCCWCYGGSVVGVKVAAWWVLWWQCGGGGGLYLRLH